MKIVIAKNGKKTIKISKNEWENIGKKQGWDRTSAYADKRNHPKIDIFVDGKYKASTTWSRTCKEAKEKYLENNPYIDPSQVKCFFDRSQKH